MSAGFPGRAVLDLCRLGNLPTVWTNVLAACVLAGGDFTTRTFGPPILAISCFYLAGMALNDLCDADFDRLRKAHRPIPSGRISRRVARNLIVGLFALGFIPLVFAPFLRAIPAALLLLAVIVAYDLRHKENPFGVMLMASCRVLVFIVTALAVTGETAAPVLIAAGAQFCYITALSFIARRENRRRPPDGPSVVPYLLTGISLVDGIVLAIFAGPVWLAAGLCGALLTAAGQRFVRGD